MRSGMETLLAFALAAQTACFASPAQTACGSSGINRNLDFQLPADGFIKAGPVDHVAVAPPQTVPLPGIDPPAAASAPIVIDNDEAGGPQVEETVRWQDIPDAEGKTHITAGARFPVAVLTGLSSKTARPGDPVQARLKVDLKIGGKLIAPRGSLVAGHVTRAERARAILRSELSPRRWMRASGALGVQFDEIVTDGGEHIPLLARPARQARIVKNKAEGRVLGVNDRGEVAPPLSTQLKAQALHLAIRGAASAGGVFSFGIVPVAYGALGAINPSFAYLHPVGKNVPHRRLKGFAIGLVSGLPGGFLIVDSVLHGQEAVVKPGDEFLAEFQQDFTGEPGTAAELIPGASRKVHGEIISR